MSESDTGHAKPKGSMPPYIAFKTLTDVIERMEREGPPTRVDPTWLESYAGGYRPTVIANLQTLGLLTPTNAPSDTLLGMVRADEASRKQLIAEMIRATYPDILSLPQNSTQGEFLEKFTARGAQGDTRRKAVSFFLKGAKYADVPVGTHWKTPAASSTGRRRTVPKTNGDVKEDPVDLETPNDGWGEVVTVDFGPAGTVVLHVGVKWLQLDDNQFTKLRSAINDIKGLAMVAEPSPAADGEDQGGES